MSRRVRVGCDLPDAVLCGPGCGRERRSARSCNSAQAFDWDTFRTPPSLRCGGWLSERVCMLSLSLRPARSEANVPRKRRNGICNYF